MIQSRDLKQSPYSFYSTSLPRRYFSNHSNQLPRTYESVDIIRNHKNIQLSLFKPKNNLDLLNQSKVRLSYPKGRKNIKDYLSFAATNKKHRPNKHPFIKETNNQRERKGHTKLFSIRQIKDQKRIKGYHPHEEVQPPLSFLSTFKQKSFIKNNFDFRKLSNLQFSEAPSVVYINFLSQDIKKRRDKTSKHMQQKSINNKINLKPIQLKPWDQHQDQFQNIDFL